MNETEKTPKMTVLRRVLAVLLVMSLLFAALCVAAPSARKKKDIDAVGTVMEQRLALVPAMFSYFEADSLSIAARNPSEATAYRELSGALGALRTADSLDAAMLIVRSGEQYVCAGDGLFNSGYNTYGAGSLMSLPKSVTKRLDAIYNDATKGGTVSDIVEGRMGGNAACTLLPVTGTAGDVLAVLAVQSNVGNTKYNMLGKVNLYALFGIFAAIAVVLILLLVFTGKMQKKGETEPVGYPADENGGWATEPNAAEPAPAEEEKKKPWSFFKKKPAEEPVDAAVAEQPAAPAPEPAPAPVQPAYEEPAAPALTLDAEPQSHDGE